MHAGGKLPNFKFQNGFVSNEHRCMEAIVSNSRVKNVLDSHKTV